MAKHWHYQLFGEEFGPVSEDVIRNLMAQGTLASDDPVRLKGGAWTPIHEALGQSAVATAVMNAPVDEVDDSDDVEDWFCQILGQELGPLSFNDLLRFAESGELSADDQIRFGADGKWRRVGSMGRLVAVLPYQPAPPTKQSKSSIDIVQVQDKSAAPAPKPAAPAPAVKPAGLVISLNEIPEATQPTWFAWIRGVEYGPSSLLQLQQWISTGQLSGTDFVKYGPTGQWCPSSTVNEILNQLKTVAAAKAHAIAAPTPAPVVKPIVATPTPAVTPAAKPSAPSVATVSAAAAVKTTTAAEVKTIETPVAKVESTPAASTLVTSTPPEPKPAPPVTTPAAGNSSYGAGSGYGGSSTSNWQASVAKAPSKPVAQSRSSSSGGSSFDFSALTSMIDMKTLGIGGGVVGAALLVIGFMYMPAGNGLEAKHFKELHGLFVEFQKARESKGDVSAISAKVSKICPPIAAELEKRANNSRPASQKLFWVAKYRLAEMISKGTATRSGPEIECERMLYEVSQVLKLPMDAPKPVETAAPKGPINPNIDKGT